MCGEVNAWLRDKVCELCREPLIQTGRKFTVDFAWWGDGGEHSLRHCDCDEKNNSDKV